MTTTTIFAPRMTPLTVSARRPRQRRYPPRVGRLNRLSDSADESRVAFAERVPAFNPEWKPEDSDPPDEHTTADPRSASPHGTRAPNVTQPSRPPRTDRHIGRALRQN